MERIKVAFLSAPAFADCDVPLVAALQQYLDITYILNVSQGSKQQSMLNICELNRDNGIYPANEIEGLENIVHYVNQSSVYVDWHGRSDRKSLIEAGIRLYRFLKKERYDIVHFTWPLAFDGFPLYLLRGKMVLTMHDPLPHSSNVNAMSNFYRNVALKLVNNFILLNHTQREEYISTYQLQKKHIYESRLGKYYHLSDLAVKDSGLRDYVLFFGQISSYKGLDILCEAMRKVKMKMPEAKLIVAGRGDIYFDINQYVEDGTIDFRNYYIPDEELAGLIKHASFTVCPYIDATQSGVIMSSYSLGTPVVVSDVGGLPEMVGNGAYGPIVSAGDTEDLCEVIMDLLKTPEKLKEYRERIQLEYSEGEHSWENIARGMVEIYQDCITKR